MKVKKLIRELKKCDQNFEVDMFAHDHNAADSTDGVGCVGSVYEEEDENGREFVALAP